jgi:CubicO group peptidase (beta-lactamase class C family)
MRHLSVRSLVVALLIVTLLPSAAPLLGQQGSPAEQRLDELVSALNSNDEATLRAFVENAMGDEMRNAFSMEEHVAILSGIHAQHGALTVEQVDASSPTALVAVLHGADSDAWLEVRLGVETDAPNRLEGIGLGRTDAPGSVPEIESMDQLGTAVDQYVSRLAAEDRFSGAVLVADASGILFEDAWGVANKDFDVPNQVDTKFNLGSMNKMFTAVAIAQLVERGELAYSDPLSKFMPDFPDAVSAQAIRIEHLLTHTSGLGSYFNDEFRASSRLRFRTVDDMMELADGETPMFEPGTAWSYSNTGFLVLGKIIEIVTGEDYYEYVARNISVPAGMLSTDAFSLDLVNKNLAVGYEPFTQDGRRIWRNNVFDHVLRGGPAGGGYSTVGDLYRFARALHDGTLVSAETLALMTSPKPELNSPSYGYGFSIQPDGSYGHGGGFSGISSNLAMWPDGRVAVVLSNYSEGALPVVRRISEWMGDDTDGTDTP